MLTYVVVHLTTALVCIFKCSSGWGNGTTWTQNNGADYECCIALKPRMTDLPPVGEERLIRAPILRYDGPPRFRKTQHCYSKTD